MVLSAPVLRQIALGALMLVALSLWVAAIGHGTARAETLVISVNNNSMMPLESVQVSPDYSTRWGANRLDGAVGPGQDQTIRLPDFGPDCFFDVQIGDASGQVFQYWGVNLCAGPDLDHR
ncbi:MAG: hypothetical protein AAGG65_19470 [Pseudomonadota bacterium]